jgi:hypothetical protein
MNEPLAAAPHDSRLDRLAESIADAHGLASRVWQCDDERRDVLADLRIQAQRRFGLDECQGKYLADCLNDLA